jgi:hypothetical protein
MRRSPLIVVSCLATLTACKSKPETAGPGAASAAASAVAAPSAPPAPPPERVIPVPTGPVLAIQRGEGIGPIRFGATVETVERHMERPCDHRQGNVCRYIGRAAEFFFDGSGTLEEIRLHRVNRPADPPPARYGVFNGHFPEGAQFGMLPHAVRELLGSPGEVQQVKEIGPAGTVEVYVYEDMRIELDRMPSGDVVLGGVVLFRPKKGPAAAPSASASP